MSAVLDIDANAIDEAASDLLSALYAADESSPGFMAQHAPTVVAGLADTGWTVADVLRFGEQSELASLLPETVRERELAESKARNVAVPWAVLRDAVLTALEPRGNQPRPEELRAIADARNALETLPGVLRENAPTSAADPASRVSTLFGASVVTLPEMLPGEFCNGPDGAMAYAKGLTTFFGDPESGKSFVVQQLAADAMCAGKHVIHWDYEQGAEDAGANYLKIGVKPDEMVAQGLLHYEYPATDEPIPWDWLAEQATLHPGLVVVVDSFARAQEAAGISGQAFAEQGNLANRMQNFGMTYGAAVLLVDHSTKGHRKGDPHAAGGGGKLGAARAQIHVERSGRFGPDKEATITLTLAKSRAPGLAPEHKFKVGNEGVARFSFRRSLDKSVPVERLDLDVLKFARGEGKALSRNQIRKGVTGNGGLLDAATDRLVKRGVMREVGTGVHPKFEAVPETPET